MAQKNYFKKQQHVKDLVNQIHKTKIQQILDRIKQKRKQYEAKEKELTNKLLNEGRKQMIERLNKVFPTKQKTKTKTKKSKKKDNKKHKIIINKKKK